MAPHLTDVAVIGGGAAGLYAAARLREAKLSVTVIESTELLGGSTAGDTGQFWLPATHLASKQGGPDSPESALAYLDAVLGEHTDSSSPARREAFVSTADAVALWLARNRFAPVAVKGRVDYDADAAQARRGGRVLAVQPFDTRALRKLSQMLRPTAHELEVVPRSARGLLALLARARRLLRPARGTVEGGGALAGRLLLVADRLGADVWTSATFVDLITADGRVTGVRVRRDGANVEVQTRLGVVLACGGFEGNEELRREHLPLPTDAAWTSGLASNTGTGIIAARGIGARLADMDKAWWTIVARLDGRTYRMTTERSRPHGIIVDSAGDRFFDEAGPAPEAGLALYQRNRRVRAVPSYLVVDNRHRQRYRLGPWLPGSGPAPSAEGEGLVRAQSLADLATQLRIDQAGLLGTVVRFNGLAGKGNDADFGRGATAVDRMNGDPSARKNPCLGSLDRSPYWAVRVYPGDAGTKGGVLTDADARVLGADDTPIPGLYAVAGTAATLFKNTAPGPGAALASALVDAHLASAHLAAKAAGPA